MIWEDLDKPIFCLAPMDDVTDTVFRRVIASTAKPDVYFTEFASVDGLMSRGREAVEQKLRSTDEETPLIAQIWGLVPDNYFQAAEELKERGYAGIDINMGCPVPKIIKNGACSALMNNRELASEIINSTQKALGNKLPLSVKTRIGFNEIDLSWIEFLLKHNLAALIVHGRTVKEMSKVPMHWEVFEEIVSLRDKLAPDTKIVANGDILSRKQGHEMAKEHKVDGVMIGRGVFQDPFVFSDSSPWQAMSTKDKLGLYDRHISMFIEEWGNSKNPAGLKKFAKVYVSGFDGASELRTKLMECNSAEELRQQIQEY